MAGARRVGVGCPGAHGEDCGVQRAFSQDSLPYAVHSFLRSAAGLGGVCGLESQCLPGIREFLKRLKEHWTGSQETWV